MFKKVRRWLAVCLVFLMSAGVLAGCGVQLAQGAWGDARAAGTAAAEGEPLGEGLERQEGRGGSRETPGTAEKYAGGETEAGTGDQAAGTGKQEEAAQVEEGGSYTSKDEVALYLHIYGRLPDNYITKKEAGALGWDSKKGNLWDVAPGMSIGGSSFGNYEKRLPEEKGRRYYECDIDYDGSYRNAKRIIYSNDGLIFYTEDHYETFEQLY